MVAAKAHRILDVKDKISVHECIGHVNQNCNVSINDDDSFNSPVKGTNLRMEEGGLRRPAPKNGRLLR